MTRFTATTTALAALLATTTLAHAGGVERQAQGTSILFEDGNYIEFGYTYVDPDVSGTQTFGSVGPTLNGSASGDVAPAYSYSTLALNYELNENLNFALIYDHPIGANVNYEPAANGYLYRAGLGSQAEINSTALTAALRYQLNENISVYGGLRAVVADGNVQLFNGSGAVAPGGTERYQLDAQGSTELGFMFGGAYERPDIALRVALTYYSATDHAFTGTETNGAGTVATQFNTTIPQQLLLEAQTGVAEGTLVFGSIRWTDWSEFQIQPPVFQAQGAAVGDPNAALVSYDNDTFTYTLGGARRVTEDLALLASITYEAQGGGFTGNLGPTDGRTSFGIGARYDMGDWRLSGGINYSILGDAVTETPRSLTGGVGGQQYSSFEDNHSIGMGFRIGYSF
ncbi:outer membrane protein transport protein [Rhodobacteraceae bacterium N5(2021)]|uniref:Outer membrane protein transport protein n=1 Tax=Gymnodinialimonas phycosphaerae TaxID=2841589 RepID=A0A975YGZ6_9RHOB|nr:outer membrane protein transport protein [Gymnodinialimonas phycosphaerae]MBY4892218.1 outer membrane protein transport protein [Gymnodinialimonas phycosphaerae]